jgi:hypothetical protein
MSAPRRAASWKRKGKGRGKERERERESERESERLSTKRRLLEKEEGKTRPLSPFRLSLTLIAAVAAAMLAALSSEDVVWQRAIFIWFGLKGRGRRRGKGGK